LVEARLSKLCDGDNTFAREILQILHVTLPSRVAEMESAYRDGDFGRMRSISHQLKGAADDTALQAVAKTWAALKERATGLPPHLLKRQVTESLLM